MPNMLCTAPSSAMTMGPPSSELLSQMTHQHACIHIMRGTFPRTTS